MERVEREVMSGKCTWRAAGSGTDSSTLDSNWPGGRTPIKSARRSSATTQRTRLFHVSLPRPRGCRLRLPAPLPPRPPISLPTPTPGGLPGTPSTPTTTLELQLQHPELLRPQLPSRRYQRTRDTARTCETNSLGNRSAGSATSARTRGAASVDCRASVRRAPQAGKESRASASNRWIPATHEQSRTPARATLHRAFTNWAWRRASLVNSVAPLDALCLDEPPRDAALEQLHDGRCNSLTLAPGSADDAELFAAIGAAARNRTLTSLSLGASPLGDAAFAKLLGALNNSHLASLCLGSTALTDVGAGALAYALARDTLPNSCFSLGARSPRRPARCRYLASLHHLSLGVNGLGDGGAWWRAGSRAAAARSTSASTSLAAPHALAGALPAALSACAHLEELHLGGAAAGASAPPLAAALARACAGAAGCAR